MRASAWLDRSRSSHAGFSAFSASISAVVSGLGDPTSGQAGNGDPELRGDDLLGVRAVAAQVSEPGGRRRLQLVQLVPGDDTRLELGGSGPRRTPSFLAAVAGFIVWMVFGLGEVMASRVVSRSRFP